MENDDNLVGTAQLAEQVDDCMEPMAVGRRSCSAAASRPSTRPGATQEAELASMLSVQRRRQPG
jgi:hypothetical protein